MSEPKDINAPDYGQLAQAPAPGPPFLRVSRGAWLTADVALELHQAADRAGNPLVRFSIYLQPGTVLSSKGDTDTVLAEAAQATVFLDPAHLASIAWTAVRSREIGRAHV